MKIRIFILSCGEYGSRIINNIANKGLGSSIIGLHEFPDDLPEFIDDFEEYIPKELPECDLILSLDLYGDINMVIPAIARKTGAKSIIVPIHDPAQIPPGLQREIEEAAGDVTIVFPKPFCSLKPTGDEVIDEFVKYFGKPEVEIDSDERIKSVKILRDAPCGAAGYVAENLEGLNVEDAEMEAGNKIHNYPCLASMKTDPMIGDTILHLAGYKIKEAVKESLGFAEASAVVDEESCMGDTECDHNCIDVCPNVKIGDDTIILKDNGKVVIDPASCGCCEICVRECPYGAIEIVDEEIPLNK
ncbi:DUF166 domain-containing protein [Methanobacterium paludis]|uniref:4Fe-4S ferredoxin-type domain-containing protein n=1 Tax=Methanobacterium paludis (strain DSM 25820 / JCM 18151 / SWAN1) TaxID=868131 RepID=F6D740_METPW|nr:DUF166 domain-containing protein [Methanobacterium paludis]AEG18407.1 protein of unknown function DUF166 [Methanobacterium paludis]